MASAPDAPRRLATGLQAVGEQLQARRENLCQRPTSIAAHPELQERALLKQASFSAALAETLRQHDLTDMAAKLAAELSIAVLRVAFERWIDEINNRELP